VLNSRLRHEYTHTVIEFISDGHAPGWLAEGLAAHVASEGQMLMRHQSKTNLSLDAIKLRLALSSSAQEMRVLYAAAYREVRAHPFAK
jgi:hypothetical protein